MKASTRTDLCSIALLCLAGLSALKGDSTAASIFFSAGFIIIALAPEREKK